MLSLAVLDELVVLVQEGVHHQVSRAAVLDIRTDQLDASTIQLQGQL